MEAEIFLKILILIEVIRFFTKKKSLQQCRRGHCHLIGHQPEGRRPPSLQSKNTSESQTKVSGGKTCPGPPTTGLSANLQQNSSSPGSGNQNRSILEAAQPTTGLSSVCGLPPLAFVFKRGSFVLLPITVHAWENAIISKD